MTFTRRIIFLFVAILLFFVAGAVGMGWLGADKDVAVILGLFGFGFASVVAAYLP